MKAPHNGADAERARSRRLKGERAALTGVALIVFLLVWEIVGRLSNPFFFAPVSAVLRAFVHAVIDPRQELLHGFLETLSVLIPGFILAAIVGVIVGIAMGRSNTVFQLLDPHITILYNTPRVALIPILMLWMGIGGSLKIVIVFLAAVFPIVVNTLSGVRDISAQFVEPARSMHASERQLLWKVILPAIVPFIAAGIKLGLGRALTTVIVAEFFVSVSGLGGILQASSTSYQMAKMFVPVIILASMGILVDQLLSYLENTALRRFRS